MSREKAMADGTRPISRSGGEKAASPTAIFNPFFTGRPRTPTSPSRTEAIDRREIIRQIKGRVSLRQRTLDLQKDPGQDAEDKDSQLRRSTSPPVLLPSPFADSSTTSSDPRDQADWMASGLAITRPRSALHRGDFSEKELASTPRPSIAQQRNTEVLAARPTDYVSISPPAPWNERYPKIPTRHKRIPDRIVSEPIDTRTLRPRAVSQASSLSKSFTLHAPTSPLVQQSSVEDNSDAEDLSLPRPEYLQDGYSRRRTYSPRSLAAFSDLYEQHEDSHSPWRQSSPSFRRESTYPLKAAHQPRRSITSLTSMPGTPYMIGRRMSLIGGSPLQNSMVGSFEESILRGRMSSTPSRPLDFTAHIGVLGAGDCKTSLKCPPHIAVPFPAVFYSYGNGNNNSDSQPSPYVGLVDLEGSGHAQPESTKVTKRTRASRISDIPPVTRPPDGPCLLSPVEIDRRKRKQKDRRRSRSPIREPRGGYRIPSKGQMQIVIKNPNKTAVKLFLIPYDVSDMQPGQKTFIRQRSYSAGPLIDMPLSVRTNLGTDRPEAALSASEDPNDRPVLRYLIHLHICCTGKGRMYLYNTIRVVFANRVPDGKEKLRNEIQFPEPRYSTYKPTKALSSPTPSMSGVEHVPPPTPLTDAIMTDLKSLSERPYQQPSLSDDMIYEDSFHPRRTEHSYTFPLLETLASRPASRGWTDEQGPVANPRSDDKFAEGTSKAKDSRRPMSPLLSPRQGAISPFTDMSEGTGSIIFSRSNSSETLPGIKAQSILSKRLKDLE